jgi:RES domain-containing protein
VTLVRTTLDDQEHLWWRIAQPGWVDPCDARYAQQRGGRWNPPGSWPTLYLNRDLHTARGQVSRLLAGSFVQPDDLADDAFDLVGVLLAETVVVADVMTEEGVRAAGLPSTYPCQPDGEIVSHDQCRPIGVQAREEGLAGVAARSAATPDGSGAELAAWSGLDTMEVVGSRVPFGAVAGKGTPPPTMPSAQVGD